MKFESINDLLVSAIRIVKDVKVFLNLTVANNDTLLSQN